MSDTPTEPVPAPPPAEPNGLPTSFDNVTLKAVRNADAQRWQLIADVGGVAWVLAERKTGGLDDDLQELATPGFKEARAQRYAAEFGRPRTEPGPGA